MTKIRCFFQFKPQENASFYKKLEIIPIVIKDSVFGKEKAPAIERSYKQYKVTYDRSVPGLSQSQKTEFLFTIGIVYILKIRLEYPVLKVKNHMVGSHRELQAHQRLAHGFLNLF
jgi:hypothetical protein